MSPAWSQTANPGRVNFSRTSNSSLDPYIDAPSTTQQQWLQKNFTRMSVFSPYFDDRTTWYSNGQIYQDLYAIYSDSALVTQHPDWIFHDQYGNPMYIPWGCSNGTCPEFAADITNPSFRAWWINQMQTNLSQGNYRGMWIDDVNMNFEVGDGWGNLAAPIDSATGAPMTWSAWRNYVAQFVKQIRQAFPTREIVHNSVWFAGPDGVRDLDPAIQAQIAAADLINMERGIASDPGLTGGTGQWSLNAELAFVDRVHAAGRSVVLQNYDLTNTATAQFALAGYFLISSGGDYHCDTTSTPDNWWSGLNVNLGTPLGARTYANGVFQRNFSQGIVLVGDPGLAPTTVKLPAAFTTLDGISVTSVTISGSQGIILTGTYPNATTPALSLTTSSLPNATVAVGYNAPLAATGGSGNYTFAVSGAPAGLAVVGSALSGMPSAAGSYSTLLATVRDVTTGASAQKTLPMTVYGPVTVITSALPWAIVGKSYSVALSATGGSGTYTWSAGALPSGLTLSGSTLSGTPSAAGASNVAVTAIDPITSLTAQKTLSLTVYSLPAISTSALPSGTVNKAYSASIAASGGSGSFTWSISGLPAGITASGSTLAGTPTTAGTYSSVLAKVTDQVTGQTAQKTFTLTIAKASATVHYVSDLAPNFVWQSWSTPQKDTSIQGNPISLNGLRYAKGIGAHAYSELHYALNGGCSAFTATIGVDDEIPAGVGSLYFQIWGDGRLLYGGPFMQGWAKSIPINVSVAGIQSISLVVTNGIYKAVDWQVPADHADWANAQLSCTW
jgi:hypothetical protein